MKIAQRLLLSLLSVIALSATPALAQDAPARAPAVASAPAPAAATPPKPAAKSVATVAPAEYVNPDYQLALDLSTGGRVVIQLRPDAAPLHVERIRTLARQGFYNGLLFHRVIDGFMAQTGDPRGNGSGGSTLPNLPAEFNDLPHLRGTVSMARAETEDSANSQFFIMLMPRLTLDKHYTVFGRVISGIQFVDAVQRGEPPANPSRIVQASIVSDNHAMPPAEQMTETRPAAPPVTAADLNAPFAPPPGG